MSETQKNIQLDRARQLWARNDLAKAKASFLDLFKQYSNDQDILICVVDFLQETDDNVTAIEVLGQYLTSNEADALTLEVCLFLAIKIKANDLAEKLAVYLINIQPNEAKNYVNLANALQLQDKYDEATEVATAALEKFPEHAKLWQVTSECYIKLKGNNCDSYELMKHAHTLDPDDGDIALALANHTTDFTEAARLYTAAIKSMPESPEAHVSYAIKLLANGELSEAWPHYEYRLDTALGPDKAPYFTNHIPIWNGKADLAGKSILIGAEQGIGDSILFSNIFPKLVEMGADLLIGCDPRLCSIYERSFPGAHSEGFKDEIRNGKRHRSFPRLEGMKPDYFIPLGSLLQHFWTDVSVLHEFNGAFLVPDTELSNRLVKGLELSAQRKSFGLSWQSGKMSQGRHNNYFGVEKAAEIIRKCDHDFVILQYDADPADVAYLKSIDPSRVYTLDDTDLKNDIEANLAVMSKLDHVVGPCIATQMFSISIGVPTIVINFGMPWWGFGQTRNSSMVLSSKGTWVLGKVRAWGRAIADACHILCGNKEKTEESDETTIFLHLPKTAGTSLTELLYDYYRNIMRLVFEDRTRYLVDTYKEKGVSHLNVDAVSGHVPFGIGDNLPGIVNYVTFLRDPIERIISSYYYNGRNTISPLYEKVSTGELTLEEFTNSKYGDNIMSRMLFAKGPGDERGFDRELDTESLYQGAIDTLQRCKIVGICEHMPESVQLLAKVLEWDHIPELGHHNVTKNRPVFEDLLASQQEILFTQTECDRRVYAYAKEMFFSALEKHKIEAILS